MKAWDAGVSSKLCCMARKLAFGIDPKSSMKSEVDHRGKVKKGP